MMFGRKKDGERTPGQPSAPSVGDEEVDAILQRSVNRKAASAAATPPSAPSTPTAAIPEAPRRAPAVATPAVGTARPAAPQPMPAGEGRKLIVGRDICLKGEVTSCDTLIVEGTVDLELTDARHIQVSATGVFNGAVDVEEADIAGRFEGDLTARDRLIVRSGGYVTGRVRYANIIIEAGGQIAGEIGHMETAAAPSAPVAQIAASPEQAPSQPAAAAPTVAQEPLRAAEPSAQPQTAIERAIPLPPRVARPVNSRE